MLRYLRQGQRWIMGFVVLFIGGVFVVFSGVGSPFRHRGAPAAGSVIEVGGRSFDVYDVERVRRMQAEQYKAALGEGYEEKLGRDRLTRMAAETLVNRAILAEEAERLGLEATPEELRQLVRALPGFQDEPGEPGSGKANYDRFVQYEYGSHRNFNRVLRDDLLAQKLGALLETSATVSEAEARDAVRLGKEQVTLALVVLDGTKAPQDAEITDDQVKALLAKDEARVRSAYEAQNTRFNTPERVHARHVLFKLAPDAPADQVEIVRKQAEDTLAAIRGGADFAKTATEKSEDPSTRTQGGDLGFFGRGQMVKPFEDAAFALAPGEISEPVRSDFGFHLIKVEEKEAAKSQPYEEVRDALARELLLADAAKAAARKQADALAAEVRGGKSLEQAAREDRLTLVRTAPLQRRTDGFIPELGAAPEVLAAGFALTPEKPSSDRVFDVAGKLVLVQQIARKTPTPDEIAKDAPAVRERMLQDQRQRIEAAWVEARRDELTKAGEIKMDLSSLITER